MPAVLLTLLACVSENVTRTNTTTFSSSSQVTNPTGEQPFRVTVEHPGEAAVRVSCHNDHLEILWPLDTLKHRFAVYLTDVDL